MLHGNFQNSQDGDQMKRVTETNVAMSPSCEANSPESDQSRHVAETTMPMSDSGGAKRKNSQGGDQIPNVAETKSSLSPSCETKRKRGRPRKNSHGGDHVSSVAETMIDLSPSCETSSPESDRVSRVVKTNTTVSDSGDTQIALIIRAYRERRFAMEQRKRTDLALGAYLRGSLGWRKDLPDAERKVIATRAAAIMKNPDGTPYEHMVRATIQSRKPFDEIESAMLKEMEILAKMFPVWSDFGKDVRGFGAASLATIIAEAGSLSNYATIARLWKRLGLAVLDGVRQGGLGKGAGAEAWIAHGYNPSRRSAIWNIGDTMLKAQVRKVKNADGEDTGERTSLGVYGQIYLDRKAYEIARNPDIAPIQAHRRAQRYMEKRLIKHLWQAWPRATIVLQTCSTMPDAN